MKPSVKYQADLKMRSEDWKRRLAELHHHLASLEKLIKQKSGESDQAFYISNRDLTILAISWCERLAK